tara:strand:- start:2468 stop:2809 length:342 start_codon:yes stop_codon:yes gene_type:complete
MKKFEMGQHLLLEVYDCTFEQLNSTHFLRSIFTKAILRSEMIILNEYTHKFNPCGVTLMFALAESHVSCHTWPEEGCLSADFYTCGEKDPKIAAKYIIENLYSIDYQIRTVKR